MAPSIFIVEGSPKRGGTPFSSLVSSSNTLGHQFTVLVSNINTTDTLGHQFNVLLGNTSTLGHEFTVKIDAVSTFGHEFKVVFKATDILGHEFGVAFNDTDTLGHEFDVELTAEDALGHEFFVILSGSSILGHQFYVLGGQIQSSELDQPDKDLLGNDLFIDREEPDQITSVVSPEDVLPEVTEQQRVEKAIEKFDEWLIAADKMAQVLGNKLDNRQVKVDATKNPAVRAAIRRLFGVDSDTITYDMFKKALELRSDLEKQGRKKIYGTIHGTSESD